MNPNQLECQWETVVISKSNKGDTKSSKAVNAAFRSGAEVDTTKKYAGGTNTSKHTASKDTAKLDRETEELKVEHVSLTVGKAIMKARQSKEWTQKELGTKVNEKPNVINDYEQARAIPNQQVLGKLERVLGVKLRGKDIGAPLKGK